jgi:hypothetical protein
MEQDKPQKFSVRMVSAPAEILVGHLRKARLKHYSLSQFARCDGCEGRKACEELLHIFTKIRAMSSLFQNTL